ncbi:MAG: hypothetical protein OXP75_06770 [Rhodospirillales bacterium]|nr:hypothetical protein [Rhodospirillales bacterium]
MIPRRSLAAWGRLRAEFEPQLRVCRVEPTNANIMALVIETLDGMLHPEHAIPVPPGAPFYEAPDTGPKPTPEELERMRIPVRKPDGEDDS